MIGGFRHGTAIEIGGSGDSLAPWAQRQALLEQAARGEIVLPVGSVLKAVAPIFSGPTFAFFSEGTKFVLESYNEDYSVAALSLSDGSQAEIHVDFFCFFSLEEAN